MQNAVYSQQLNSCLICKKQPVPQSQQNPYLSTLAILMIFLFNFKLALLLFTVSYYFSTIIWKCPVCKRQIDVTGVNEEVNEHVIVRLGNCLVMVSKRKWGVVVMVMAVGVAGIMGVGWYQRGDSTVLSKEVRVDWGEMVRDTGKNAQMDNEIHAKHLLEKYAVLDWKLEGVYLGDGEVFQTVAGETLHTIKIKMNPTQNKNTNVPDFLLYPATKHDVELKRGDIVSFQGDLAGVTTNWYVFRSWELHKTGQTFEPENIKVFDWLSGHLRNHQ